jgi:HlyD family secretion protein
VKPFDPRPALPFACLLGVFVWTACGGGAAPEEIEPEPPPVEALAARSGTLPLEERLNGVVRADNQLVVRPEVSGRVVEVLVRSGERVERGQPLVRLETRGLEDQVRQAQADVRLARADAAEARAEVQELEAEVSRTRKLAAEGLMSQMELETQEARLDAARAAADSAAAGVDQAEASADERRFGLGRAVVRAPSGGHVGRREVEVGTMVDPSSSLFVLGDLSDLVVEIPLTEAMLSFIEAGQPVTVSPRGGEGAPGAGGAGFRATLSRVSPFLEPGSFTTTGEIDLDGVAGAEVLRPGMFVTVDVLYGESERATLVPASALWEDPQTGVQGVYVFERPPSPVPDSGPVRGLGDAPDGSVPNGPSEEAFPVALRPVEVVAEGRAVLGVDGVEPGEWVVVVGQHLLAGDEEPRARVRATSWERVLALQDLQREDLLASFLDRQQRMARERGATPPTNAEFLDAAPAAATEER